MLYLREPFGDEKLFALVPPARSRGVRSSHAGTESGALAPQISVASQKVPRDSSATTGKSDHKHAEPKESGLHAAGRVSKGRKDEDGIRALENIQSGILTNTLGNKTTPAVGSKSNEVTMNGSRVSNGTLKTNGIHRATNGTHDRSPDTEDAEVSAGANGSSTSTSSRPQRIPLHSRTQSNPLAPPFIVSAPGKVIVHGEHAVVHGKAAIAAAISLRSYLLVTTLSKSKRTVSLKFADIGLDHTWNIHDLPWEAFSHPTKKKKYYDMVTSLDPDLVAAMHPHIVDVSPAAKPEARKVHMSAASAFLYLFLSLGSSSSPACVYAMRSAIPIAAGLGSSASISVCISAALLIQSRALSGPHPDQMSAEAEEQLQRINRWSFVGEMLIHGTPSGVDNTVATNGRAVLFQRKDYSKPPSVKILRDFPELPLLLVNTKQPKSTAAEVAKVAQLKARHPAVTDSILDSIDAITRSVHDWISDEAFDARSADCIAHLGELMAVNHGLLTALGVSHPKLERLRYLVDQAGVGWTKLTGAGGGGCAITLLRLPLVDPESQLHGEAAHEGESAMEGLQQRLEEEGFERYRTTLGGDGVGVLYPAVIDDEEIHEEMFLTVEGRDGVEALVERRNDPGAWKYWRP